LALPGGGSSRSRVPRSDHGGAVRQGLTGRSVDPQEQDPLGTARAYARERRLTGPDERAAGRSPRGRRKTSAEPPRFYRRTSPEPNRPAAHVDDATQSHSQTARRALESGSADRGTRPRTPPGVIGRHRGLVRSRSRTADP